MLKKLENYISENKLFAKTDSLLIAVSGGIDSCVLLDLLVKAKYSIAIAHCNFGLRGTESDDDEKFVKQLADNLNVPFHSMHFNTMEYAELQGVSIQMAARELRYNWFDNICRKYHYNYIAIAHNSDDCAETFFINLLRGTGIKGLTGIKPKNDNIVRPLLFSSRFDIIEYANKNNISYREDSSNANNKYVRNKIRLNLFPLLSEINTDYRKSISNTINHLNEVSLIYQHTIDELSKKLIENHPEYDSIDINKLSKIPAPITVLFELLRKYNFNSSQVLDIYNSLKANSGIHFYSSTHRLIKDRDQFIIIEKSDLIDNVYYIENTFKEITNPINLTFLKVDISDFELIKDSSIAFIDYDKLCFPLILRRWQKGDYFQPLGMNQMKKLSNFFIDIKLSIIEKEKIWILLSAEKIVWIIGLRIDNRFKITSETKRIIKINLFP